MNPRSGPFERSGPPGQMSDRQTPPAEPPAYLVGVDLAQSCDFTATVVAEVGGGGRERRYLVRHLDRVRDRSYDRVVAGLKALVDVLRAERRPGARPEAPAVTVVLDGTGIGRAVYDLVRAAGLDATLVPVTITGGSRAAYDAPYWRVPKVDLVEAVAVVMQQGRLRISPELPLTPVLAEELGRFRKRFTPSGNETFASWREDEHDDLVLAAAVAVWWGERQAARPVCGVVSVETKANEWAMGLDDALFTLDPFGRWP